MTRRLALVLLLSACGQQVQGAAPETTPAVTTTTVATVPAPAVAAAPAVRLDPPTTTSTVLVAVGPPPTLPPVWGPAGSTVEGRCTQWEPLLIELAPPSGWSVDRMSKYMWRETRCIPNLRSTTADSGLLQVNDINHPYLRGVLGEQVDRHTLFDAVQNVRAAAALCTFWVRSGSSCYRPWGGSG